MGEIAKAPEKKILIPTFGGKSVLRGLESVATEKLGLAPPHLKIVHKKSSREDVGEPGDLLLGSDPYQTLVFIILRVFLGQRLTLGEGRSSRTVCASADAEVPHPSVSSPMSSSCADCEYGAWVEKEDGRVARQCRRYLAFLVIVPEAGDKPAWYVASGTAYSRARDLIKEFNVLAYEGQLDGVDRRSVRMSTELQRNHGVTWYAPIFTILPEETPRDYRRLVDATFEAEVEYVPRISGDPAPALTPAQEMAKASEPEASDDLPF